MELYLTSRRRISAFDNSQFVPEDMPMDVVLKALDLAATAHKPLFLIGNEPLLFPNLEQLFASAHKRGLELIPETTGLMPTLARDLVKANCTAIALKIYPRETYSEENIAELKENIAFFAQTEIAISLIATFDDPTCDMEFFLEMAKLAGTSELLFRLPCRRPPSAWRPFIKWYSENRLKAVGDGVIMGIDCGVPFCAFTDEELGAMTRMGFQIPLCSPRLGVLPDGHVTHCLAMSMLPGKHVGKFRTEAEFMEYYYEVFKDLQWQCQRFPGCTKCVSRFNDTCIGVSMAQKADLVLREFNALKDLFKEEDRRDAPIMQESERIEKLWQLGRDAMMLMFYADAVECLEELRALKPEVWNIHAALACAYWECARFAEAEDEFRKGSRLNAEDPISCLAELHKRLVKNGNVIKARLLKAEIEKLILQKQK